MAFVSFMVLALILLANLVHKFKMEWTESFPVFIFVVWLVVGFLVVIVDFVVVVGVFVCLFCFGFVFCLFVVVVLLLLFLGGGAGGGGACFWSVFK